MTYETKGSLTISLFVHINDDGRWTAWISNDDYRVKVMTQYEFNSIFKQFMEVFILSYNEYHNDDYGPILVASQPIYGDNNNETNVDYLINIDKAVIARKNHLESKITRMIGYRLKELPKHNMIKINDLALQFNIHLNITNPMEIIPFRDMLLNKVVSNPEKIANINILIDHNDEKLNELIPFGFRLFDIFEESHKFKGAIEGNFTIEITSEQLNKFINGEDDYLMVKVVECLNSIAYERIMNGTIQETEKLIELCLSVYTLSAYPLATMGLWYLRNEDIPLEEAELKGMEFYQKAIVLDVNDRDEYIEDMKQKFCYEMSIFYIFRQKDYIKGAEYINKALEIGERGYFYDSVLELQDKLPKLDLVDESASSKEQTDAPNLSEVNSGVGNPVDNNEANLGEDIKEEDISIEE